MFEIKKVMEKLNDRTLDVADVEVMDEGDPVRNGEETAGSGKGTGKEDGEVL